MKIGRRWLASAGRRAALAGALLGGALACGAAAPGTGPALARTAPPRPSACDPVAAGSSLQPVVEAAPEGRALCLAPGRYDGPLLVRRPLVLWGPRSAVIRSSGEGTTVRLEAPGAALLGVTVDGSGGRFDLLDAAVRVEASDVRVEGVRIENAVFGLLVEKSRRVVLRGNEVVGDAGKALGLRGDGIRLWETRDSIIEGNALAHSRDMVVWYASDNRIVGNSVVDGRYGTHLMYSHRNRVLNNLYQRNVVGIFAMYSRALEIRGNRFLDSTGAAGMGLGVKESGDLRVADNLFAGNTVGVYVDTSPLYLDERNRFEGNAFLAGDTAIVFHSSAERNHFVGNSLRGNQVQVRVEGRGDALAVEWRRNDFDDYAGYDLDGDGVGDVPYELRSLSGQLTARFPALAFFRGSPALAVLEIVGRAVPLFQPRTLLVDAEPRMEPLRFGTPRAH